MKNLLAVAFVASALMTSIAAFAAPIALQIRVEGLEVSRGGALRCAIFDEARAKSFPTDVDEAVDRVSVDVRPGEQRARLEVPGAGLYAVSCTHDENGNGQVDKNFFGIPKEGWGVSRGARPSMRGPRFGEAKFQVEGAQQSVVIRIDY